MDLHIFMAIGRKDLNRESRFNFRPVRRRQILGQGSLRRDPRAHCRLQKILTGRMTTRLLAAAWSPNMQALSIYACMAKRLYEDPDDALRRMGCICIINLIHRAHVFSMLQHLWSRLNWIIIGTNIGLSDGWHYHDKMQRGLYLTIWCTYMDVWDTEVAGENKTNRYSHTDNIGPVCTSRDDMHDHVR
jgi:hypothetical protein